MKILILNLGSTSSKYALFKNNICVLKENLSGTFSFEIILESLKKSEHIQTIEDIHSFGIRIVHGGKHFFNATEITPEVLETIQSLCEIAPLHNPLAVSCIKSIQKLSPKAKVFGVFDTAFHRTLPEKAKFYAIPQALTQKHEIERYGFHGIACQSILRQIQEKQKNLPENIIICHLGGGCSVTAIKNGKSVDTSMGFSPLEGIMMSTRSGDIDPEILLFLQKKTGKNLEEIELLLSKESGLAGLSGGKNMKEIIDELLQGNDTHKLAFEMFAYRLQKYIFAYFGVLQGLDLLVFSGGIGEGSSFLRQNLCENLQILGVNLDGEKNKNPVLFELISQNQYRVSVCVAHPEEEEEMFKQIQSIL